MLVLLQWFSYFCCLTFREKIVAKFDIKKVYIPKVGDVISISSSVFQNCFAVVTSERFFKKHADIKTKEIFEFQSHCNSGHIPVFVMRINNGTDKYGNVVIEPSFAFVKATDYGCHFSVAYLYSIYGGARKKQAELMLESFNIVFATESNRARSNFYHVVDSLKNISEHVLGCLTQNPETVYGFFIRDLQLGKIQNSPKQGDLMRKVLEHVRSPGYVHIEES